MADALGNAPIVLVLTQGMEPDQRNQIVDRATLVATAVLVLFAFGGEAILTYLHVSLGSLRLAGGLLLLLIALEMLQGHAYQPLEEKEPEHDVAITPLALPLLAGPGTLTTVMLMMSESPDAQVSVVAGILSAMVITWLIVRQSVYLDRFLGATGAIIATQLLGFLLAALAIEIGSEGIRELFLM